MKADVVLSTCVDLRDGTPTRRFGPVLLSLSQGKDSLVQPSLVVDYFVSNGSSKPHPCGLSPHVSLSEYKADMREIRLCTRAVLSVTTRVIFLCFPPVSEKMLVKSARGSSSTRNANTIIRRSYKDAFLGIDPVVRNIQTSTISSISQVDTLFNEGHIEEALKGYEEILLLNPDNRDVHNKMSRCDLMLSLRELQNQDALPNNIKRLEDRLEKKLSENTKELEVHLDNSTHQEEVDSFIASGTITRYVINPFIFSLSLSVFFLYDNVNVDALESVTSGTYSVGISWYIQSLAMKADRLLSLNRLDQAEETISKAHKLAPKLEPPFSLGMLWESYICIIHGKIEMALGRFENAVKGARQAHILDPLNDNVTTILERVHMAKLARDEGDKLFHLRKYMEAYEKYLIGLKYAWPNVALLNKLAACQMRLNQWKRVIKFSNLVKKFYQDDSLDDNLFSSPFFELGKSDEIVKENEEKALVGEDISDSKLKRGVEKVSSVEEYNVAISSPGHIIVFFNDPSNAECAEFTSCVESLCMSFPLVKFFEVDINRWSQIAKSENVHVVPAFKIYSCKKYAKIMINPEQIYLKFWIQICTV
ncbi:TPR repeat-containing thioredoxin TTL1-like [Carex rostrata]